MKKFRLISFIAAAAILFALSAVLCVSAELVTVYERKDNLAKNKPYQASKAFTATPASMGYQDIDGKELTDGVLHTSDLYGTWWHGFDYRLESPMYATVDLGETAAGLIEFRMQFVNHANSGIDYPTSLEFFISDDNVAFTPVGTGTAETTDKIAFYHLKLKEPVSARYVKAVIGKPNSGVFVFCSEFEIYNSVAVQKDASELAEESAEKEKSEEVSEVLIDKTENLKTEDYPVAFYTGSRFYIKDGCVYGGKPGDTPATILENLKTIAGVKINGADGKELTTGGIYSGCTVAQYSGGEIKTSYTVMISGDLDGKAGVTDGDAKALKNAIVNGTVPVSGTLSGCGDVNRNGVLGITDYIGVKLQIAGKVNLYSAYTENLEKWSMKIKYSSATLYVMSCTASNGKALTLNLGKTSWGTWNIGSLTVGGLSLGSGGTDWEYVYRAASAPGSYVWSGGNHGNENLVELKFYDGISGKELIFDKVGAENPVENLVIVEKTKLNWGDVNVSYCDVIRTYTIVGQKISLKVSYDFTKNCYYALSYTCMFPVPKTVGLYIDFLNDNGTVRTVETLKVGAADYSGAMYKNNAASACRIYGYQNTQYSFLVQVYTKNDSLDNFKGYDKTFYWDMNATQNKLYFSKFSGENATAKVPSGSHWDTSCSWTLLIDGAK